MATRTLKVEIVGDARGFGRAVNEIEGHTRRMASGFSKVTGAIGLGFAALGGTAIIGGVKKTIDAASDLNETVSKSRIIFGSSAREIEAWSKGSARSMGLSRQEALASAASFGDMFLQLKLGRPQAVDMSKSMVQLAADFASFHNADITQVLEAQSAAFRGEYDALQRFIPNISAARVEQVALAQSHKATAKELTAAEKAQAVYSIMLKDGARATGDFARTAGGAANQQRILRAQIDDMKASIGQALIGPFTTVVKVINEQLIPAARKWWQEHGPAVRDTFRDIAGKAAEIWHMVEDHVIPTLEDFRDDTVKSLKDGLDEMSKAWENNHEAIQQLGHDFRDLQPLWKIVAFLIRRLATDEIPNFIKQIGWLGRAWHFVWKLIVTANKAIASATISMAIAVVSAMSGLVDSIPGGRRSGFGRSLHRAIDNLKEFRGDFNAEMDKLMDERVNVTARAGISWTAEAARFRQQAGRMAAGGMVDGPGTGTSDSVPVWLSRGEYVVNAAATSRNLAALEHMNAPGMAQGGQVDPRLHLPAVPRASTFQPIVEGLAKGLGAAVGRGLMKAMGTLGGDFGSGSWTRAIAELRADSVPFNIISTFRAGARTHASGSVSYHALNRAVDLTGPNMLRIFNSLVDTNPTELIYAFADVYKSRSGWHPISRLDPITWRDHTSHVHAAYDRGGWLRPGWTMAWNGTGRPEPVLPPGGGGPTITINIGTVLGGDARRVARELEPAMRNALKASLGREGKALAKEL